ncbi:MAG: FMN-binding protein [Cryobacterium sp.]|uniref:FMN-binding protein n=1 Tax=unclassified Cryobacterium TaxID=2649013 RepID=UPI0018C92C95|nr:MULTISPECIES: FMN-binding protein [unclassified Cryobacterium]MCY7404889.1 FMN-binding protein [Cryobacterium sp.]MEC5153304.1 uncharacterized protein with FMN-binding domain [Cryobacterium sp. CAN_C3]
MRARAAIAATLASLSVVAIGWELGAAQIDAAQNLAATSGTTSTVPATAAAQAAAASTAADASGSTATAAPAYAAPATAVPANVAPAVAASGTFTGSVAPTRFGNVQVSVTINAGVISGVTPLQLTNHDGRSVQISNYAAPVLLSEILSAQSASVHNVSGATYTTDGYLQSLQSALDAAGF